MPAQLGIDYWRLVSLRDTFEGTSKELQQAEILKGRELNKNSPLSQILGYRWLWFYNDFISSSVTNVEGFNFLVL